MTALKQKLRIFAASVLFIHLYCVSASAAVQTNVPRDVQKFAETDGIASFKENVMSDPIGFGFANTEELNNASVGLGFQVHYLDADQLQASDGRSLKSVIKPAPQWEFLITTDGKAKTFFTVMRENGQLSVFEAGGKAEDFQLALTSYETYTKQTPILIKNGFSRYLLSDANNQEVVIPAFSGAKTPNNIKMDNTRVWPASDLVKQFKQIQEQSKQAEGQMGGGVQMGNVPSNADNRGYGMAFAAGALVLAGAGAYAFRKKTTK